MDSKNDAGLGGATICNLSQHIYKKAGYDGMYTVIAMLSDTIIFSSIGYRTDTIEVSSDLLEHGFDIGLLATPVLLDPVRVNARSYAFDSAENRKEYAAFNKHPFNHLVFSGAPASGFGITLSPFTYFSRKQRERRRFKKQLAYNEQQDFIDYNFSPAYVHRLSGLTRDSLQIFMVRYRPSYDFVRKASAEDLLHYVNGSLIRFKKSK